MPEFPLPDAPFAFHRLTPHPQAEERWKKKFLELSRWRPPTLILPCHARDLWLESTFDQLVSLIEYPWPGKILLVLNALGNGYEGSLESWLKQFPEEVQERLELLVADAAPDPQPAVRRGKGFNLWLALHYLDHLQCRHPVVWQDIDCVGYDPGMTARLVLPILDPSLGFRAARAFYARVESRLYGRLTRQLYRPLLDAIRNSLPREISQRQRDWIETMRGFKYPLAGETALDFETACRLHYDSAWGLETRLNAQLSDLPAEEVCQVDWADRYIHRHHPIGSHRAEGLRATAVEVVEALVDESRKRLPLADWKILKQTFRDQVRIHHDHDRKLSIFNQLEEIAEHENLFEESFDEREGNRFNVEALRINETTRALLKPLWKKIVWHAPSLMRSKDLGNEQARHP